ncbi:ATP synthase subunit b, partial [Bienertia sinuspersici]
MAEFFFNDFCSTPSCPRKIGPLPTFELLTPSPTAVSDTSTLYAGAIVTEEISAKHISVTDNAFGDHSKHVDEGVSVSSPKDGQLIVADAGATGIIPQPVECYQTNKKENDDDVPSEKSSEHTPSPQAFGLTGDFGQSLPIVTPLNIQRPHDDGSCSSIDRSARIPDVAIPEYIRESTPVKVKEYVNLVEEEIDVDDSHLESLIADIEKSIKKENYSTTDEDIKEEFGEEVKKIVTKDVHKEEKGIADHKNDDSFICETEVIKKGKAESSETIDSYNDLPVGNCHIIVSRTLHLREISIWPSYYMKNVSWLIFSFTQKLRHTLESLVLFDIINPANPDIHVCMTKTDFLSLAFKTWLTGASNYINWLINERKKKEYIESIIAEKEIDSKKAKDNPCYDTMKAKWLKDKQKMTYQDSSFFANKCRQSMSEWEKIVMFCKVFCKVIESSVVVLMVFTIEIEGLFLLLGEVIKTTSSVVFIALKLWNGMMAYSKNLSRCHLAIDLKKRKDKEKHLANLRVKRLEKVFLEDEKIKKERERHEQE